MRLRAIRRNEYVEPISIHAPLTGCDIPPAPVGTGNWDFNPRTPHGVRPESSLIYWLVGAISIHAPLTGCDPPGWLRRSVGPSISIHAPLTGCDAQCHHLRSFCCYFNPRTPHGVRLQPAEELLRGSGFQSTHPSRGATFNPPKNCFVDRDFNPRTPHGVRLVVMSKADIDKRFQSTHPSRGATRTNSQRQKPSGNFNPRTPHGVRLHHPNHYTWKGVISIHAPLTGCDRHGISWR